MLRLRSEALAGSWGFQAYGFGFWGHLVQGAERTGGWVGAFALFRHVFFAIVGVRVFARGQEGRD